MLLFCGSVLFAHFERIHKKLRYANKRVPAARPSLLLKVSTWMLWLQIDTIKTMKLVEAAAAAETCSEKNSMNLMELAWTKLSYRHLNICFYLNDSLSLAFVCCHCYCKWQMVCLFFAANPSLSVQLLSFPCFEPVCFFYSLHFFTWSIIQTRWFSLVYIAIVLGSYQKIYFCHVIHDETHKYMYLYIKVWYMFAMW